MTTGEGLLLFVAGIVFVVGAFTMKSYSLGRFALAQNGILQR